MDRIPESWRREHPASSGKHPASQLGFQLRRLSLHPGASWSLSWVFLFIAGFALPDLSDSRLSAAVAPAIASLFPALTLIGALGFASRPLPMWLVPTCIGVAALRASLVFADATALSYAVALPYEAPLELMAAVVLWRAPLIRNAGATRWLLCAALAGVACLDAADALLVGAALRPAPLLLLWAGLGAATMLLQIWAMWYWIARREVRVERAEGSERELWQRLGSHIHEEDALREKEALLFDRYERAPDLLVSLEPKTHRIISCNRKFSETLGYRRGELVGRLLSDFADLSTVPQLQAGLERAFAHSSLRDLAFRLQRRSGGFIEVLANATLLHTEGAAAEIHAILRNVSRFRLPSADSTDSTPEGLYHTLVERSPVALFFADKEGRCVFVNRSFCEISGLTPDEARGHGWINRVHPDDRERVTAEWGEAIEKNSIFRSRQRLIPSEGVEHAVLVQSTPLVTGASGPLGHVGSVTLLARMD